MSNDPAARSPSGLSWIERTTALLTRIFYVTERPEFWRICSRFARDHGWTKYRVDMEQEPTPWGIVMRWQGRRLNMVAGERIHPQWDYTPDPNVGVVVTVALERKLGRWAEPEGTGSIVGRRFRPGAPPDSPAAVLAGLVTGGAATSAPGSEREAFSARSPHLEVGARCPTLIARCRQLADCYIGFDRREAWGELGARSISTERLAALCTLVSDLADELRVLDAELRIAFPRGWSSPEVRAGRRAWWRYALSIYALVAVVIAVLRCYIR